MLYKQGHTHVTSECSGKSFQTSHSLLLTVLGGMCKFGSFCTTIVIQNISLLSTACP